MKYDYLVCGAGLFGAVFARQMTDAGKTCLVIDQRDHAAGNCFTDTVEGITRHKYGPHIFHTNAPRIWEYANRFARFNHFVNRIKTWSGGRLLSMPINLLTIYQLTGIATPAEAAEWLASQRVKIDKPRNLEEFALSEVGPKLYEACIRGYTTKQWQREPHLLPAAIIRRLPIRLTYDDNYYDHQFQGIPIGGYTQWIANMLDGVRVELGTSLGSLGDWTRLAKTLVYTGKIDEYFGFAHGELEYRTQEFDHQVLDRPDFQGNAIINYNDTAVPYTRIIEHKHFEFGRQAKTVVTRETPVSWERGRMPMYPVNDEKNQQMFARYAALAKAVPDVVFGGRLAEYRYYDMDQVIASALTKAEKELA